MEVRNSAYYNEMQQQMSYPTMNGGVMVPQSISQFPHAPSSLVGQPVSAIPLGLQALYDSCARIYPDQINPLQVTAVVKFWLGGPDPLDYISMYLNNGDEQNGIPPHWHYISFGLSDLHGDGRVHQISDSSTPSGFGFELTFRLKKETDETSPPTWPAAVMQALAKYVFQTGNILCAGDHVSWHCPLDNSESRIEHMLMTEDPQLGSTTTPFGLVTFIQIVGVCLEELQAAQQWNGLGIIDLMKSVSNAGGSWLLTDMRRGETIFEIDPELRDAVDDGIATQGSNLSGVSARCSYAKYIDKEQGESDEENSTENDHQIVNNDNNNKEKLQETVGSNSCERNLDSRASRHSSMSVSHDRNSRMSFASETGASEPMELTSLKYFDSICIKFNYEAGNLLPLALRGRLKHGRHFTFKNIEGDLAITFVTSTVFGSFVNLEQPYALHGPWLQVLIPDQYIDRMLNKLDNIGNIDKDLLPTTYTWNEIKLAITLESED